MISSASPISLIARAAPLGDGTTGKEVPTPGDTGFSALFADLMPGREEAVAVPEPQLVTLPLTAAKTAMTGKFAASATAGGKNLPVELPEDSSAYDEALPQEPTFGLSQTESAAANPALALAPLNLPTALPQGGTTVQQLVASQAARRTPSLPDTAAPAAQLATALAVTKGVEKQIPGSIMARTVAAAAPIGTSATSAAPGPPQRAVQLSVAADPALPGALNTALPTVAMLQPKAELKGKTTSPTAPIAEAFILVASPAKVAKSAKLLSDSPSPALPDIAAPAIAAPAFTPSATLAPVTAALTTATAMTTPVEDVARIIDQLAAAREALAPATAALSIDHADFGELSLRIDQRADGGLAVQLAASNPEAHRAVSAAMNAQGQQLSHNDNQQGSASPHANAADREARQQRQEQGQDRSQPRGQSARNANTSRNSERQDGTFA